MSRRALPLRVCFAFLRLIRPLVPRAQRDGWEREWRSELEIWWNRQRGSNRPSSGRLFARAWGSIHDAAWLRRQFTRDADAIHDARLGLRLLRRRALATVVAVVVLALAHAAAIGLLALVDSLWWHPLPHLQARELPFTVWQTDERSGGAVEDVAPGNFLDWRDRAESWSHLAAVVPFSFDWTDGDRPRAWDAALVTEGFFEAVGLPVQAGRTFLAEDHVHGRNRVVVLSHAMWREVFDLDPSAIGRSIRLDGEPHEIVGVLPATADTGFLENLPRRGVFAPYVLADHERRIRGSGWWQVVGKLRPGVSADTAQAELTAIATDLAREHPRTNHGKGASIVPLRDHLLRGARPALPALVAIIGLLLALAWADVSGLALGRSAERRQEWLLRRSLGAGRARLLRQLLVEHGLVAIVATVLAIGLAAVALRQLALRAPASLPQLESVALTPVALLGAVGLAALATLWSTLPSLVSLGRLRDIGGLGRSGALAAPRSRARRSLAALQLAIAITLLSALGSMVQTVRSLLDQDLGFAPRHLVTLQVFGNDRHRTPDGARQFVEGAITAMGSVPGVQSVSAVSAAPFHRNPVEIGSVVDVVGAQPRRAEESDRMRVSVVTAQYFETIGASLRMGRFPTADDRAEDRAVAWLNEAAARVLMRDGGDPLGREIRLSWHGRPVQALIVGVVSAIRQERLDDATAPEIFLPHAQAPTAAMTFVARTSTDPGALVPAIQRAFWEVDPLQPINDTDIIESAVARSMADRILVLTLLVLFGAQGVVLAALGVFGQVHQQVTGRRRELSVRSALGATPAGLVRLVTRDGVRLVGAGLVGGSLGALATAGLFRGVLFRFEGVDPALLATALVAMSCVAALACVVPARRAARQEPARALRAE